MKKFVPEAALIPRFYGIAYRDFLRRGAVCYPIPLNWVVRWARSLWLSLRFPADSWWEYREAEIRREIEREAADRLHAALVLIATQGGSK